MVTQTKAALWTDSRYWVQAERQMDCNWELEKDGRGDLIVIICHDNAGHMGSDQRRGGFHDPGYKYPDITALIIKGFT